MDGGRGGEGAYWGGGGLLCVSRPSLTNLKSSGSFSLLNL